MVSVLPSGKSGCRVWCWLTQRQAVWAGVWDQSCPPGVGEHSAWFWWFFSVPLSGVGYYSHCTWTTEAENTSSSVQPYTFLVLYLELQKGLAYGWMHLFNFWSLLFVPRRIPGHIVQCTFLCFSMVKSSLWERGIKQFAFHHDASVSFSVVKLHSSLLQLTKSNLLYLPLMQSLSLFLLSNWFFNFLKFGVILDLLKVSKRAQWSLCTFLYGRN